MQKRGKRGSETNGKVSSLDLSGVLAIKGFPLLLLLCNSALMYPRLLLQPAIPSSLSRSKEDLHPERSYLNCDTGCPWKEIEEGSLGAPVCFV